jgi:hemerythrin-like domain-containing protein
MGAARLRCDFADPIGALVHCHRMIDRQLALLEEGCRMLREGRADALGPALDRLGAAKSHFAGPGDRHTQDEELSLFPRLRAREQALGARTIDLLEALEAEHRIAETIHADFREHVDVLRRDGVLSTEETEQLGICVSALAALYRTHMRFEDEVLFPAAARVLEPGELLAVSAEMLGRR